MSAESSLGAQVSSFIGGILTVFRLSARIAAVAALAGASLAVPSAASATPTATRCLSDNGSYVNGYFRVPRSDVIWLNLQGLRPPCVTVVQGNIFYRAHGWIAQLPPGTEVDGGTIATVYPAGYRPDRQAPMQDFLSKVARARYVVSRDGRAEITRVVERRRLLDHAKLGEFGDLFVAPDSGSGVTVHGAAPEWTTLEPFSSRGLGLGEHTIEIYWTLTRQHCDGFGTDAASNCLPAGESLVTSTAFNVVPRRPPAASG
jgi:hypothetical protein